MQVQARLADQTDEAEIFGLWRMFMRQNQDVIVDSPQTQEIEQRWVNQRYFRLPIGQE